MLKLACAADDGLLKTAVADGRRNGDPLKPFLTERHRIAGHVIMKRLDDALLRRVAGRSRNVDGINSGECQAGRVGRFQIELLFRSGFECDESGDAFGSRNRDLVSGEF